MHSAAMAASAIERCLAEQLGLYVGVCASDGLVTIVGRASSAKACEAATDAVAGLPPAYRADSQLEIELLLPKAGGLVQVGDASGQPRDDRHELAHDQRVPAGSAAQAQRVQGGAPDTDLPTEPPCHPRIQSSPVVGTDTGGRIEAHGGFGLSAMDALDVGSPAQDQLPRDEALADAIRRELREDAAAAALVIAVAVRAGVVTLGGTADRREDAEATEEMAPRVPGVVQVVDKLQFRASSISSGDAPREPEVERRT